MNHESTRAIRTRLNPRLYVVLFAAAVGAGFFWIDYLPQPSRVIWLERIHAYPIISGDPIRYRDLKTVLAGIECDRAGMNVYVTCPCGAESLGFKNVPFNYPAATLWLGRLAPARLSVADGDWLGPAVGIAFLLALSFVFQGTALWEAAYSCALIISPPVLLGIERANFDLVLFCLLFLSIRFLDRLSNTASYAVAFGLGMLKLYPIGAVIGLIRKTKKSQLLFWLTAAAEVIFVALTFNNLRAVARTTPQAWWQSFGYSVVFIGSAHFNAFAWATKMKSPVLAAALVALVYFARRTRQYWLCILNGGDMTYRPLFIAGAALYSLCFAAGTSFNYRLIFLLFTVPYLFSMPRADRAQRRAAALILVALLCVFWLSDIDLLVILLRAAMTWLLFIFYASVSLTALVDSLSPAGGFLEIRRSLRPARAQSA